MTPEGPEPAVRDPRSDSSGASTAAELDRGAAPPPPAAFAPGDVLGQRFRIVRLLGRGGMGEVYEAEDLELRERVALKTIRGDLAGDPRLLERFRRETQLARRVSHRNVCRTHDLEQHAGPSGTRVTFLVMELLEGETLAARIARRGRIPLEEALPLAAQMAAGLGAAHQAGVVHRDFKPSNALLVPEGEGPPRVVITDFGLARAEGPLTASPDLTDAGATMGTAAYMAPEQVEGGTVGPPADVYALGVVLYEMVTGRRPFEGQTALSTAVKRIKEAPVPPRAHVPELDPRWERVILRCLERQPGRRYQRAEEVARHLPPAEVRPRPRWALPVALAAGVVLLGLALAALLRSPTPPGGRESTPAAPTTLRRSVAVIGFKNLSGRPASAWISTALAEMVGSELAMGGQVRVVPGEDVARMKRELRLQEAETLSAETARRVRRNLGADVLVTGAFLALGDKGGGRLRVDVRMQDATSGETLPSVIETASESELAELVARAGAQLRARLGLAAAEGAEAGASRAALPSHPEAARLYAKGLARLRDFDALAARDLLQRAVLVEPTHPLIHDALAQAWGLLGYEGRRREAARLAFEQCVGLPREATLLVEGQYRETTREWAKAAEIYRALWGFYPDSLEYGLRLVSALRAAGRGGEAREVVEELRRLPAPAGDDPRIDLAEVDLASTSLDHRRMAEAAQRAAGKGAQRGARLVVARARMFEGWARQRLGDVAGAQPALAEARRIYEEAGDQRGLAYVLHMTASFLDETGDFDGARRMNEQALAVRREIGDEAGAATTLNNLAIAHWDRDELREARRAFESALATYRRIDDRYATGLPVGNLALVLKDQGDVERARRMLEQAIPDRRAIGDKRSLAYMLGILGQALLAQGELAASRQAFDETLELTREAEKRLAAYALTGLGEVARAEGDRAGARRRHEEALAIRQATGAALTSAESRLALAVLALEEGAAASAAAAASEAARDMQSRRAPCKEAVARAVAARARAAADPAAARADLLRVGDLLEGCQAPALRLQATVHAARARHALQAAGEARAALQKAAAEAGALGLAGLELEARLALAETAPAPRRAAALQALATEARRRGHMRLSRAAEAGLAGR